MIGIFIFKSQYRLAQLLRSLFSCRALSLSSLQPTCGQCRERSAKNSGLSEQYKSPNAETDAACMRVCDFVYNLISCFEQNAGCCCFCCCFHVVVVLLLLYRCN